MTAAEPIYFAHFAHRPVPWPERRGRWIWAITDGMAGRTIATGHAITRWGAVRKQEQAYGRCVFRAWTFDLGPVLNPLSKAEACWICAVLDAAGVPVDVDVRGPAVVLTPRGTLTTEQEVRALTAVLDRTDSPVRWAGVA
jgi:hypothetical protein